MVALNPFRKCQKLVIKVGSALLVDPASGQLCSEWLRSLCSDIHMLREKNVSVVLVSSGAIAIGKSRLNQWDKKLSLSEKQACAAAGQALLTQAYEDALAPHNIMTAQILLTLNDTENRRRWLNARATLDALLSMDVVPIINENDTVATDEIRYGDNDRLSARTAQMVGADTLILLSDIDGLYTSDPRQDDKAAHIPIVEAITEDILQMGGGANKNTAMGSGGMATKLSAAEISINAGCHMCIMDGRALHPVQRLIEGEQTSWFKATQNPRDARRQWISGHLNIKGQIDIDAGAAQALKSGRSLLAVGITKVHGSFQKGDTVSICGPEGENLAQGLIGYNAEDMRKIIGKNSQEIASILGYDYGIPSVHRDNMVMKN